MYSKLRLRAILLSAIFSSVCFSRQITGSGEAAFFDSTAYGDAIRINMKSVSPASTGKMYVAWLVSDSDTQYTKLGQLTVQGNGDVSMVYRDNSGNNLLASNKKFAITQETSPFSGNKPTPAAIIFADSLHGPGTPNAVSPLVRIRNCVVAFSNTAQTNGLAVWFLKQAQGFLDHAGLARDGAVANSAGDAKTHSDHIYDFIMGKLTGGVLGNGSVALNGDSVGYGYRRYGDLGTKDSSQGGAGSRGGTGYHVNLALNQPAATPQMKQAGTRAMTVLTKLFGTANDSGWAKEVTVQASKIIAGAYTSLPTEGNTFYVLATKFINGTVGAADTAASTGGIRQAYYHIQRMAAFILKTPTSKFQASKPSLNFGTVLIGSSKSDSVFVRNSGSNLLLIDSIQISSSRYSVQPSSASLAVGDSVRFRFTYSPNAVGSQPGQAIFFSNAPSQKDTVSFQASGTLTSVERDHGVPVPQSFQLDQNFPNPFNSSTEIHFQIPLRSRVQVVIFDVLGKEIQRLVDGEELDPGTYRTRWNAVVASGSYFCRLEAKTLEDAQSFSAVRQMLLLK